MAPGPDGWGRVEEIFHLALEQPPESRDRWLDQTCAGGLALRSEVSSLLESDSVARDGFVGALGSGAQRPALIPRAFSPSYERSLPCSVRRQKPRTSAALRLLFFVCFNTSRI